MATAVSDTRRARRGAEVQGNDNAWLREPEQSEDHGQSVYKLECLNCGEFHGANGSDGVICNTGKVGTDHGQSVYKLECLNCGEFHGANGSDLFQRRCPHCDPRSTGEDLL